MDKILRIIKSKRFRLLTFVQEIMRQQLIIQTP